MDIRLNDLNKTIVNCKKCPRLVKFVRKVSTIKRKQNIINTIMGQVDFNEEEVIDQMLNEIIEDYE